MIIGFVCPISIQKKLDVNNCDRVSEVLMNDLDNHSLKYFTRSEVKMGTRARSQSMTAGNIRRAIRRALKKT